MSDNASASATDTITAGDAAPSEGAGASVPASNGSGSTDASASTDGGGAQAKGDAAAQAVVDGTATDAQLLDLEAMGDHYVELTVNGQVERIPAKELKRSYESRAGRRKLLQQIQARQREVEDTIARYKSDPTSILGEDPAAMTPKVLDALIKSTDPAVQKVVEQYFQEMLEVANLPEDERRARELDERERALERRERERQEAEESKKTEAEAAQWRAIYEREFGSALEAEGLPNTPRTQQEMVRVMRGLLDAGYDARSRATIRDAASMLREELTGLTGALLKDADPNTLRSTLGEEQIKRLREADLARVRAAEAAEREKAPSPPKKAPVRHRRPRAEDAMRDVLRLGVYRGRGKND